MTDLLALCAQRPVRRVAPGDVLIESGTRPEQMFILRSGAATVERDGVPFARIDTPGAVFGEMAVVLGSPATATVRAVDEVEVHVVDDPDRFLDESPGAAYAILRMTAARLDGVTRYLIDVKRQYADQDGHLGMVGDILDVLVHHQAPPPRTGSARDPEPHAH